MKAPGSLPVDLLASHMLDGTLLEAERAELLACIQNDPEACDRYIEHILLHAIIRKELGAYRPATLSESLFGDLPAETQLTCTNKLKIPSSHGEACGRVSRPSIWNRSSRPEMRKSAFDRNGNGRRSLAPSLSDWMGRGSSRTAVAIAGACAVALMVLASVLSWPDPANVSRTGAVAQASPSTGVKSVRLESGAVRLALDQVGEVVVEGPAELDLLGPMRARLKQGRIRMRVTEQTGHGFVVETPDGEVTDLGTEFGVAVSSHADTEVMVFEGAVDLAVAAGNQPTGVRIERLLQGEGLTIGDAGQLERLMAVVTGQTATFQKSGGAHGSHLSPLIVDVADNINSPDMKKFYEIVSGGLCEEAPAYGDRAHEWNGIDDHGIPAYLLGADYIKPFNNDKVRQDLEILVTLARPARLFVFYVSDDEMPPPEWLRRDFRDTGDYIGVDASEFTIGGITYMPFAVRGTGTSQSIDAKHSVWERVVREPGVVKLGPNTLVSSVSSGFGMYGIAAVALDSKSSDHIRADSNPSLDASDRKSETIDQLQAASQAKEGSNIK